MIEVVPDMPEGVSGIRVSGRISGEDIRAFKPSMDEMLGVDEKWVAHTLHALSWMVPGELEIFSQADLERAKEWAAG